MILKQLKPCNQSFGISAGMIDMVRNMSLLILVQYEYTIAECIIAHRTFMCIEYVLRD